MIEYERKYDWNSGKYYTHESLIKGIVNHCSHSNNASNSNYDFNTIMSDFKATHIKLSLPLVLKYINVLCLAHHYNDKSEWRTLRGASGPFPECPKGKCTYGPSTWYNATGLDLTFWNDPGSATPNNTKLPQYGFRVIWNGNPEESKTYLRPPNIQPGDICTMYVRYNNGVNSAHACMWTGHDWRSDFVQNNAWVYFNKGTARAPMILWRNDKLSA